MGRHRLVEDVRRKPRRSVTDQERVAEALIRADGRGGMKRISPGERMQYLKLAQVAIDTLASVEPYHGKAKGSQ